jgi:hypothetical protein
MAKRWPEGQLYQEMPEGHYEEKPGRWPERQLYQEKRRRKLKD